MYCAHSHASTSCTTITDVTATKIFYASLGGAIFTCRGITSAQTVAWALVAVHLEGDTMSPTAPARTLSKEVNPLLVSRSQELYTVKLVLFKLILLHFAPDDKDATIQTHLCNIVL